MWFSKYAGLLLAAGMVVPDILVVQARGLNPELVDMNRRMANNVKSAKKESGVKGPREPKYFRMLRISLLCVLLHKLNRVG